ncbi:hypothetical protein [Streptomyces sp. NPDC056069]|uniref:hypothetical protein n=1 Tax=Streptomyces sp. NPDC056069 TaxID=3345702 RepID=UPI0035D9F974
MTGRRGRGRPPLFTPEVRERYLAAVAAGATLKEATADLGLTKNLASQHAAHDPEFAAALRDARAVGRRARLDRAGHDESRYTNHRCRCPKCTRAASTARMARKARAEEERDSRLDLTAVDSPQSPTSFSLLVSSSSRTPAAA